MTRMLQWGNLIFILAVLASCSPAGALDGSETPNVSGSPTEQLQAIYLDYLATEGYRPQIDNDGDVQFKHDGNTYVIKVSEDDPQFFRMLLYIGAIDKDEEYEQERFRVLQAADYANAKTKVVKITTSQERVWGAIELFVHAPEDFQLVFSRCLSALDAGVKNFLEKMHE